ncbi:MAG: DUF3179 domain-containing protein [Acidiferrobacterales bacterium]
MSFNPELFDHWLARPVIYALLIAVSIPVIIPYVQSAQPYNGFDVENALVPADQIHQGGPPRDGIPAIDNPEFVSSAEADYLQNRDYILGFNLNGITKAYPIKILNHHEIVNDSFGDRNIVITFCPLCGTGIAFAPEANGESLQFGVSGLLYNSDMLLYDRKTNSLWSQITGMAISGPLRGTRLRTLPITHTTWQDWRKRHPDTVVLSTRTGYRRNYQRSPYGDYTSNSDIYFPVTYQSRRYHPKERVIGIEVNGKFRAYPFSELGKTKGRIRERFNGIPVSIIFDKINGSGQASSNGKPLQQMTAFWFAWYAFHPDTSIYTSP